MVYFNIEHTLPSRFDQGKENGYITILSKPDLQIHQLFFLKPNTHTCMHLELHMPAHTYAQSCMCAHSDARGWSWAGGGGVFVSASNLVSRTGTECTCQLLAMPLPARPLATGHRYASYTHF